MVTSWYQIKQREDRHKFSSMAGDAVLGIKIIEAQVKVGTAIKYSTSELKQLLHVGQVLVSSILSGIEFLKGSTTTKSLNPELIFIINRIRSEDYLSLSELEGRCKIALEALQIEEKEKIDPEKLSVAEHLFNDVSASSKIEGKTAF